jgi:hypothetical protein
VGAFPASAPNQNGPAGKSFAARALVWLSARQIRIHMKRFALALACTVLTLNLFAQGGAPQTGVNAAMVKMFGDINAFTAPAEVRVLDKNLKEITVLPMTMSLRDGKLRTEMDISQVKGAGLPPEAAQMMKQAGLDKTVTLIQPDKKLSTLIYPNMQAYAEMPVPEEEVGGKMETKELGTEEIDGHPTKKVKLTSTDAKGGTQEAIVWQATDLKNFPIRMQMTQRDNSVIVNSKTRSSKRRPPRNSRCRPATRSTLPSRR